MTIEISDDPIPPDASRSVLKFELFVVCPEFALTALIGIGNAIVNVLL